MRTARIIFPTHDNNGNSLAMLHRALKTDLCRLFGGYTALQSFGGWIADNGELYEEAGVAYEIFCDDTPERCNVVRDLAVKYGQLAAQLAMSVAYPNGDVSILNISISPPTASIAA